MISIIKSIKTIKYTLILSVFILLCLSGCETLKDSSKYQLNEGFYKSTFNNKKDRVYIVPQEDSIKVYLKTKQKIIDTLHTVKFAFPQINKPATFSNYFFSRRTFDLDVISVLFKYRPKVQGFPNQFNTSLNGAVYVGYRNDIYKLSYRKSPLQVYKRVITHYAYSIGAFTGLGSARIDEYDTRNAINIEYDGVVNLYGIALILGVDKLSFGLLVGADNLLDENKKYWVNEHEPWVGLSIGLNLN